MLRRVAAPLLLVLAGASAVSAGEPTERLRALFGEANRILRQPDAATLEERLSALRALLGEAFDAREAAAFALGRAWTARTEAERDELARLYTDLVERAYLGWLGSRVRVGADGVRVAFDAERRDGERAVVQTTVDTRDAGEAAIDYRMRRRDGRWTVHDVVVDGLSLAESYRAQVQRVLQRGSYADLLARLHDKALPSTLLDIARGKRTPTAPPSPVQVASVTAISDAAAKERRTPDAAATPATTAAVAALTAPPPALQRATPAPAVETSAPSAPAGRSIWVQVGAFRSADAAGRLVERLAAYGATVTIGRHAGGLTRVLVGPFADQASAASALRQLAAGGHRPFIAHE